MATLLFPGQGSQEPGMGAALFEQFATFTRQASQVLGYSIVDLCLRDPQQQLGSTRFTQPALYVVNALSYLNYRETASQEPSYVIGHSVGEYAALFAAGVFDFVTGLRLIKKRGELMSRTQNGGMAAILGLTEEQVGRVLEEQHLSTLAIANYNARTQLVIAGPQSDLLLAKQFFMASGAKIYQPLRVSGAFHSHYLAPVQGEFRQFLQKFHFAEPAIPIISTVHAQLYTHRDLPEKLVEQLTSPVRWKMSVEYLARQGEETYIELGPGNVLTKLVRRIHKEMGTESIAVS